MEYGNSAFVVYYSEKTSRNFFTPLQKMEAEEHLSSLNLWENLVEIYDTSDQCEGMTGQSEDDIKRCLSYYGHKGTLSMFKQIMKDKLRRPPQDLWKLSKRQFFLFWTDFNTLDDKDAIMEASIQAVALTRNFISKRAFSRTKGFIFEENVESFCSSTDTITSRRLIRRRTDFAAIGMIKEDLTVKLFDERPLFRNKYDLSLSVEEMAHVGAIRKMYNDSLMMKGMEAEFMAKDTFGLVSVDPISHCLFFSPFCPKNKDGKDEVAFGRRCLIPATLRSWEMWEKTKPGTCICMRPGNGCFPLIRGTISSKAKLYGMDETISYIREKLKVLHNVELGPEDKKKKIEELKIEYRNFLRQRSCREIGKLLEPEKVLTREEIIRIRIAKFSIKVD